MIVEYTATTARMVNCMGVPKHLLIVVCAAMQLSLLFMVHRRMLVDHLQKGFAAPRYRLEDILRRQLKHRHLPPSIIDVISIGSLTRPDYLAVQEEELLKHSAIRYFTNSTEKDDIDQHCAASLSNDTAGFIKTCHDGFPSGLRSLEAQDFATNFGFTESPLEPPEGHQIRDQAGWLCAQRRFAQALEKGLASIVERQQHNETTVNASSTDLLPDYLVLMDDDTYFNVDIFSEMIANGDHPNPADPTIWAGCLFRTNTTISINWDFPYGGFGTVLSRGALERATLPLYCQWELQQKSANTTATVGAFQEHACRMLKENALGELPFFTDGMNIVELFSEYSKHRQHFCLHGDWLVGYLAKYIKIERMAASQEEASYLSQLIEPIQTWPAQCGNHSMARECSHSKDIFCHRQTPEDWLNHKSQQNNNIRGQINNSSSPILSTSDNVTAEVHASKDLAAPAAPSAPDTIEWVMELWNSTQVSWESSPTEVKYSPWESSPESLWEEASKWITPRQIFPQKFENNTLAWILHELQYGKILSASSGNGGSQLKLLLELEGGQKAIFKPKRSAKGNDHHNAEIAAFHLARILNLRRVPIVVGRRIHIESEIFQVADAPLLGSFVDNSTECFKGTCEFCKNPQCPDRGDGRMDGAMIMMLPNTDAQGKKVSIVSQHGDWDVLHGDRARQKTWKRSRYLDVAETSILDFLIQNVDRHSYEFLDIEESKGGSLIVDQGKAFEPGSSLRDDLNILKPLLNLCVIRKSTLEHLQSIAKWKEASLSSALRFLTSFDLTTSARDGAGEIISQADFVAIDRRFEIVLSRIGNCIEQYGIDDVVLEDYSIVGP